MINQQDGDIHFNYWANYENLNLSLATLKNVGLRESSQTRKSKVYRLASWEFAHSKCTRLAV